MSFFFNDELNVNGTTINSSEIAVIDGVTAGTVSASKAIVVDSNKDIVDLRNVDLDGNLKMNYIDNSTTINKLELKFSTNEFGFDNKRIIESKPYFESYDDTNDNATVKTTDLNIQASNRGKSNNSSDSQSGGNINITSGRGLYNDSNYHGSSGSVTIQGANGTGDSSSSQYGGSGGGINIYSGSGGESGSSGGGTAGTISVNSGSGGSSNSSSGGNSGEIYINTGSGGYSTSDYGGDAGVISIYTGSGGGSSNSTGGVGGNLTFSTGYGGDSSDYQFSSNGGNSGSISFSCNSGGSADSGTGGAGGSITFGAGDGGTSSSGNRGNGGAISFTAGTGYSGGSISLTSGSSNNSSSTNETGGSFSIYSGSGYTGGAITISAGSSYDTSNSTNGADITLEAGSSSASSGNNGNIILKTGTGTSASQGYIGIKGNEDSFTTPPELRFYDADNSTYISLNSNIAGDSLSVSSSLSATSLTTGSMSVSSTSITNSSGSISFDDENLSTTGKINNLHIKANGTNYGQSILISGDSITEPTTSSQYNVGIGYKNLEVINGSSYNVGIGYQNLKAATTGDFNTTLGFENLLSLQTASYNNSIGFKNLADLTSGDDNIGIGRYAHRYLTTGSNNVAVGKEAGFYLYDGDDNVFLGKRAGYNLEKPSITNNPPSTYGSNNNVFIGYLADVDASNAARTNCIVIGANTTGEGTNKAVIGDSNITDIYFGEGSATAHASQFNSSSDQRIKTNIQDYSTSQALQKVNDIGIKEYNYIDTRKRGTESTPGFIAQDVETHLPIAVKQKSNFIPNEYRLLTDYTLVETTDFINGEDDSEGYYWKLTINDLTDLSTTGKYKVLVSEDTTFDLDSANNNYRTIKNIDGENKSFLLRKNWSQIFLVGKEITDFRTLEKSKIFILHHGAIQELNSLLEAEKIKVANLETELATEKSKVATLESEVEAIKAHVGM